MSKSNIRWIGTRSDLEQAAGHASHALVLYSGGLDSTWLIAQLRNSGAKVTALSVDIGDAPDIDQARRQAERLGAQFVSVDARERFARDAVMPAVRAHASYLGVYPLSASLSRPVLAMHAVEHAEALGCDMILHSATASQNSLRRLNGSVEALGFEGFVGSPCAIDAVSRESKTAALARCGMDHFAQRAFSADSNLWCREFEAGALDDPKGLSIPDSAWSWTVQGRDVVPTELCIGFQAGLPTSIDGQPMGPVALIDRLNREAGTRGIGRFEGFEYLSDDTRVLEVREAPAACVLLTALRHLEMATLPSALLRAKMAVEQTWVAEAIEGRWFGAERAAAERFIVEAACGLDGDVRMHLDRGQLHLAGIDAASPAYLTDRDDWELTRNRARGDATGRRAAIVTDRQPVLEGAK